MRRNYQLCCEEGWHTLSVELGTGDVALLDHDVESELALVVLGGDPCVCLQAKIALKRMKNLFAGSDLVGTEGGIYFDQEETFLGGRTWWTSVDLWRVIAEITREPPWNIKNWRIGG